MKKEAFRGNVLYSDLQRTGYIHTNHEKINRLYENTVWGLKSNFLDMPTDCPQRNERLGWTGDAQVFAPTASYHMDTRAFFHKFVKDLRDEQKMIDGAVPNYVPNIGHKEDAGSVWGDIATFLPYTLYTYFGNEEEMQYCYPLMKDWVDYIDRKDGERGEKHYLFDFGFHFGDWLALDGATPVSYTHLDVYKRQTHGTAFSRQGCADRVVICEDGTIPQIEITSCGLNDGPLPAIGQYSAYIACHLTEGDREKVGQVIMAGPGEAVPELPEEMPYITEEVRKDDMVSVSYTHLFRDKEEKLQFVLHYPNDKYKEHPEFRKIINKNGQLQLEKEEKAER